VLDTGSRDGPCSTTMKRPTAFEKIHQGELLGRVTLPDRVLFRGHLKLRDARTLGVFLAYSHVLLKDFGAYAEANTAERSRVRYSPRFGAKRYTLDVDWTSGSIDHSNSAKYDGDGWESNHCSSGGRSRRRVCGAPCGCPGENS
jgi:hypothetical protein